MREVSCKAIDMFFAALPARNLQPDVLADGTGYSVDFLRNKRERIEWPAFARFMANAGKIWDERDLIQMGGAFFRSPLVRSVLLPARLLFGPRDIYHWVYTDPRGLGQQMFPCVQNKYLELGPRHARLELWLPDGYATSPEFFYVSQGTITDLSRILGFGPARVERTATPRGIAFDIHVQLEGRLLSRMFHSLRARFRAVASARELKAANEELTDRYRELEDYRQNLERKVDDRTRELATTVDQLKEAQAARDKLFANVNHEIRTPLSLVMLAVSNVQRREAARLDAHSQKELGSIESESRRLLRLIDGLLVLAAKQEGRLKLKLQACDLGQMLRQLVQAWIPAADARGIGLSYDGPTRCPIQADENALERIVTNLLANAVKFTPNGGSIDVRLTESADTAEIAVQDTGVGIDDEFKHRIFGRFEQGAAAVHSGTHGSGIGLSIVRELAVAHGGKAEVESAGAGKGTTFRITLPRQATAEAAAAPDAPRLESTTMRLRPDDFGLTDTITRTPSELPARCGTARGTILVAEDDPNLRAAIGDLLSEEYRVLLAPDGLNALAMARRAMPDMLVSDIGMPGMDGLELTRRFRELPGNRLAPVLLLTAFGAVADRLKGFDAGAIDYVPKPFEPEELRARVRSQLALRSIALKLHESEKLAAVGVLSSGLAHELRNPANGIVNAMVPLLELIPAELKDGKAPVGQLLRVIEHCAAQVAHLSRQLLGLRSTGEIAGTDTPWSEVLAKTLSLSGPALEKVKFENTCDYAGQVWCSASMICQVFTNLLENGAQAAGPGGWVKLSSRKEDERIVIEVSDSGPGVPPELRERIFEAFFTTKAPGVGTGLGLTTSRDIVSRHGGLLEVRPNGKGTLFRVELPITHKASPAADRPPQERVAR